MNGPYARAALRYFDLGWTGVLPMLRGRKAPCVAGYHGKSAPYPTRDLVQQWVNQFPHANLAIRLPVGVVGIDLDVYHGGQQTIDDLTGLHGDLPATWTSTARDDGSGIRLFRAQPPPGTRWASGLGQGVDIIHAGNRYVMAWPSIHPGLGVPYRWAGPTGQTSVPSVEEL
jgi:hypothetical protein